MDLIDDDVLLEIFRHLGLRAKFSSNLVCRRWHGLLERLLLCQKCLAFASRYVSHTTETPSLDCEYLWSNEANLLDYEALADRVPTITKLEFSHTFIDCDVAHLFVDRYPTIDRLVLSNLRELTESLAQIMFMGFRCLKSLSIINCDIHDDMLEMILKHCSHLEELDLSENYIITGRSLDILPATIKSLNISFCEGINSQGLEALTSGNGRSLSNLSVSGLMNDQSMALICNNLVDLKYFNCVYSCTREYGSQKNLLGCIGNLKLLETLILRESDAYYGSLDDIALNHILSRCRRLKRLELYLGSGTSLVTDASLATLHTRSPGLKSLLIDNAASISEPTLESISHLSLLKSLELVNAERATKYGFINIFRSCQNLTRVWIGFDLSNPIVDNDVLDAYIALALTKPTKFVKLELSETAVDIEDSFSIPPNMSLRLSRYVQTSEGLRYNEKFWP